jgi:hypothetical protein
MPEENPNLEKLQVATSSRQLEQITSLENILLRLIKCEHYFDLCSSSKGEFWHIIQNSLGESVCLFWCHIFGSYKEDSHYTRFFAKTPHEGFTKNEIKTRLLKAIKMDEKKYSMFRQEVKHCRDKYIAHKESEATVIFPYIDKCRVQAEELRRVLAEYCEKNSAVEPNSNWPYWAHYYRGNSLKAEHLKAESERAFSTGINLMADGL